MSLSLLLFWYDLYHFPFSLKHITMEICDPLSLHSAYFYTLSLSPPFACSIQVRSNLSWVFSMLYSFAPSSYFHKAFTLFWEGKGPLGFYVFQLNTLQRRRVVDREVGGVRRARNGTNVGCLRASPEGGSPGRAEAFVLI